MNGLADRFRHWYDYERDCNAKSLEMLASVPADRRGTPEFQKAVDRMAHLVSARRRWLQRVGGAERPVLPTSGNRLEDLAPLVNETESDWSSYFQTLTEADLPREVEYTALDGKRYRYSIEGVLTQTFGHAFYHRGQIAQLVAALGGTAVDTDYVYWCKLQPIEAPAS